MRRLNEAKRKRRELLLTRLEYDYIDEAGVGLDEVTTQYLDEQVRDILVSYPADEDEELRDLTLMLLNMQKLFGRLLEPYEAGAILYSPYQRDIRK